MNETMLLEKIADEFKLILKDSLTGIYIHGSVCFGCFNPDKSDLDFIAVTKNAPNFSLKKRLIETLLKFDKYAPKKGFEMSVVLKKYCLDFVYPTPFELHFSNAHKESFKKDIDNCCAQMKGTDIDLAAHFTVIKNYGITLLGESINRVFGSVPEKYYIDSIIKDVKNADSEIFKNPVYTILNLCRVAAYIKERLILSKSGGGEWGIKNLPDKYSPIIKDALICYGGVSLLDSDKNKSLLKEFAHYMLPQILK